MKKQIEKTHLGSELPDLRSSGTEIHIKKHILRTAYPCFGHLKDKLYHEQDGKYLCLVRGTGVGNGQPVPRNKAPALAMASQRISASYAAQPKGSLRLLSASNGHNTGPVHGRCIQNEPCGHKKALQCGRTV